MESDSHDLFEAPSDEEGGLQRSAPADSEPRSSELEDDLFGADGDENEPTDENKSTNDLVHESPDKNGKKSSENGETKELIKNAIVEILKSVNINEFSMRQIREELASRYSIDTDKHKKFIRGTIEASLMELQQKEDEADSHAVDNALGQRNTVLEETPSKKRKSVFSKPALLSAGLAEMMGVQTAPRGDVVKFLWKYIKENNLQNPKDRRFILFDEKLQKIFKKKSSHFMKLSGLLAKELKTIDQLQASSFLDDDDEDEEEDDDEEENAEDEEGNGNGKSAARKRSIVYRKGQQVKRRKTEKPPATEEDDEDQESEEESGGEEEEDDEESDDGNEDTRKRSKRIRTNEQKAAKLKASEEKRKQKKQQKREEKKKLQEAAGEQPKPKRKSVSTKLVKPEFAEFLNIDPATHRTQVVKALHAYIKDNNLQNPNDRREILLNEKLQEFLHVKKCTFFSINKYLNKVFYDAD